MKALDKMPQLQAGLQTASLKTQPVSSECFWPKRLAQALGHIECAQVIVAEIFGDGVEATGPSNTDGLKNKCAKPEIEQAGTSPKIQQLLSKFRNYGCSSEVIRRLNKYSEVVLESALAYTLPITNPRSPNGVAIANVRIAAAKSRGEAHSKRTWSKWTWNYKQKKTVCRRCQQPGHIARDCTTDIQALARSDQPAASGEGTGSNEDASTQPPPAKRQRSVAEQEQSRHIAPHCTTDIQELARSDQPAASGEGTGPLSISDSSIKEQEQPWYIAPDSTTDIQALAQRDQPAAS